MVPKNFGTHSQGDWGAGDQTVRCVAEIGHEEEVGLKAPNLRGSECDFSSAI